MSLEARKLEFVKVFLNIKNEDSIARFEQYLENETKVLDKQVLHPMTLDELHKRIDQAESDFRSNRFKTSKQLLE